MNKKEKAILDSLKFPEPPKITVEIDNGIFDPFFQVLAKVGLYRAKEKLQAKHPEYNVKYSFEVDK